MALRVAIRREDGPWLDPNGEFVGRAPWVSREKRRVWPYDATFIRTTLLDLRRDYGPSFVVVKIVARRTRRDELAALRAEVERMRPVVEAAEAWHANGRRPGDATLLARLGMRIDVYNAAKRQTT